MSPYFPLDILWFQITTQGKNTRQENDIDIDRRATEMYPNINAIDIWLSALKIYNLPNAAAIFQPYDFFLPCGLFYLELKSHS